MDIRQQLSQFICSQLLKQPGRVLTPGEPLISSGLIDSFNLVDLALFVEDTYGFHIEDSELNRDTFDNLDQLCSLIETRKIS